MLIRPKTPTGSSVFCEDVRHEIDGKQTFVGVYRGAMLFDPSVQFPALLPKFSVAITYVEGVGESEEAVELRLFMPQTPEPAAVLQLYEAGPRPEAQHFITDRPEEEKGKLVRSAMAVMELSPALIAGPGEVRVRAVRGSDVIALGALQIAVLDASMAEGEPQGGRDKGGAYGEGADNS